MLFPSREPRESPKKARSHEHPTLFQQASEVWRAESRSILANYITANSLLPVFLLSTFTALQVKLFTHYHSDCVSVYWQSLTLSIISLILSLRPCVAPSCPYLCSYLYHFSLVLPSHSFLELPFFWSIRAVSPSCSCSDSLAFYCLDRLLPSLSARTWATVLECSPTGQIPQV